MSKQTDIENKLAALDPVFLEVVNESHMHSVPKNSETHFRVTVVSHRFADQSPVARHRMVNGLLADELANGVHALALHTRTPEEWSARGGEVPASPQCLGGSKHS
jgi:BolA protein